MLIDRLSRKLDELEQQVKVLQRNRELDAETSETRNKETPRITLGSSGLSISSADSDFVFKVRGYVQADSRWYMDDHISGNDTFLMRRVRPIIEGTVFEKSITGYAGLRREYVRGSNNTRITAWCRTPISTPAPARVPGASGQIQGAGRVGTAAVGGQPPVCGAGLSDPAAAQSRRGSGTAWEPL